MELPSFRPSFLGQPLAFLRAPKAFADFFTEVLKHGFPIIGSATGLLSRYGWLRGAAVMATNLYLPE